MQNQGTGPDDRPGTNGRIVDDGRAHPDEDVVFDRRVTADVYSRVHGRERTDLDVVPDERASGEDCVIADHAVGSHDG